MGRTGLRAVGVTVECKDKSHIPVFALKNCMSLILLSWIQRTPYSRWTGLVVMRWL